MLTKAAKPIFKAAMVAAAAAALGGLYLLSRSAVDWDDTKAVPFKVTDKLEIAAESYVLKQGSLSLLCGPRGPHLMLQTRLPRPRVTESELWPLSQVPNTPTSISFDWQKTKDGVTIPSFDTRFAVVSSGVLDTIVTASLRQKEKAKLADWFRRGAPQSISFDLGEYGGSRRFNSVSSKEAVHTFFRRCPSKG